MAVLAVNPFETLDIYGSDKMPPYVNKPLGVEEPHTYAMAEEAYKMLVKSKGSQSLVVSGESGAGKTETNKVRRGFTAVGRSVGCAPAAPTAYVPKGGLLLALARRAELTERSHRPQHLMRYLAFRSKSGGEHLSDLATLILQSNPVLEV